MTTDTSNIIKFHGTVIDLEQPVELTTYPDWNHGKPFTIRDYGESLIGLAEIEYQEAKRAEYNDNRRRARAAAHAIAETFASPVRGLLGNMALHN